MAQQAGNDNGGQPAPQILWQHQDPRSTRMYEFKRLIEEKYGTPLPDYEALRLWSIQNLNEFWENVWYFTGVVAETTFIKVGQWGRDAA